MTDSKDAKNSSFGEKIQELIKEFVEVLDSLTQPEPELIPIRVRDRRRYTRR